MAKVFHVRCPNIESEMRIMKINASLGDFLKPNDIIATAENRDFILEIRTTISGVLSKIHVKNGSIIFTGEAIADINTEENCKDDNLQEDNFSNNISIDDFKQAIRNPYDQRYPDLGAAVQKYEEDQPIAQRNTSQSFEDKTLNNIDTKNKKKFFSEVLKIFNHKFSSTLDNLSSVDEVNLENLLKILTLFGKNFQKKHHTEPMIEPFLIKSLNAAVFDDITFKKDVLNFVMIQENGDVKKSFITNITKKNFFDLQNDINSNNGLSKNRDVITIVSNHQSKMSFASNKNTIIFNKIDTGTKISFLTYNMEEISNSGLISNFLTYLENPGWIFFLL